MKTISIKQPWASLIVHGIKDIENRTWACPKKYIGQRVLIHASGFRGKKFKINLTDEQAKDAFATIAKECMFGSLGQGAVYKETYIVEIDNLPQQVIDAIEGKRYCGCVSDMSFVKEVINDSPN